MNREMGSRLAITEKRPDAKGRGFGSVLFHLFDWNKMLSKRKKKLFSNNKLLLPQVSKKFGEDEKMPKSKQFLIADKKNLEGPPVSQKQTDIDNQMGDPGPVAKLMGLESMPIVLHKKHSKPSPVSGIRSNRYEAYEANESRPQKLQRTGGSLERRQQPVASSSEALPSNRRARRQHHHKLSSPIKSPRLLSKRSTSRLMEAATKILEPGLQSRRNRAKCALTYVNSSQADEKVPKDGIFMRKGKFSLNDSVVELSSSFSSLNGTMESVRRHEGTSVREGNHAGNKMIPLENRSSPPFGQVKVDAKRSLPVPIGKDRPESLDVQSKIGVQSRAHGLYERKNCMHGSHNRKILTHNQLHVVKGKLVYGSRLHNKPLNRRDVALSDGDPSSCTQSRTLIRDLARERVQKDQNGPERKNKAPKRRPNDDSRTESGKVSSFTFEKRQSTRRDLINGKGALTNQSINCDSVNNEFKNHEESNDASGFQGNGIVSFTFSSPMRRSSRSFTNGDMADKRIHMDKHTLNDTHPGKLVSSKKIHIKAYQREETSGGDSLSALLEQKIEELNSLEPDEFATGDCLEGRSTASILGELISALRPSQEDAYCSGSMDNPAGTISHDEMVKDHERFQAGPESGISSANRVSEGDHPSPMSILDVSFSNDSCLSGSPDGSSGHKPDFGSSDTGINIQSVGLDTDLLDSASSFDNQKFGVEKTMDSLGKNSAIKDVNVNLHEVWFSGSNLGYPEEAKSNASLLIENISLSKLNGKDSFICLTLEAITKALGVTDSKERTQPKSLLLDCMIECLDSHCNYYLKSGSKLPLLTLREKLGRMVCEEIEVWNGLAGRSIDEIVEEDIRRSIAVWTKFEIEAFEIGAKIENDMVNELVGEIELDLCI